MSTDTIQPLFFATVEYGKLEMSARKGFTQYLQKFEGQEVTVVVKKRQWDRSINQNNYYWGVIVKLIADEVGDDPAKIHALLKVMFLSKILHVEGKDKKVMEEKITGTTTKLSTAQTEDYYQKCRVWALDFLGVVIPLPNEADYL